MSYVKQTWVDKETPLDAAHLNHIEDGVYANSEAVGQLSEDKADKAAVQLDGGNALDLWEQGGLSNTNGVGTTASMRIRTSEYISDAVRRVELNYPYFFTVFAYNAAGAYVGVWDGTAFTKTMYWLNEFDFTPYASSGLRFKLMVKRGNDANITPELYTLITFTTEINSSFDRIDTDISEIRDELFGVVAGEMNNSALWEMGGITGTGSEYGSTTVVRTISYIPDTVKLVYTNADWGFMAFLYDDADTFIGVWNQTGIVQTASTWCHYLMPAHLSGYRIRLIAKRFYTQDITVDDAVDGIHFLNDIRTKMFYPTPTLTFIDDDGSLNALENWESITDEIGVKITSALVTGVMGDGETNPQKASWADVARLQNKGYEFVSHTHNHINITERTDDVVIEQFKSSIADLREHGCEPRYLVYPYNAIDTAKKPLVKKYFTAAVGLGGGANNVLPIQTHDLKRYSINSDEYVEKEYNGAIVQAHAFKTLDELKGYINAALINGGWIIIMTHLRNDEAFYHDDASRSMIIDLCKYAVEKGMLIQTFGEAFQRYKNIVETGTMDNSTYYITDCNGVVRYR